VEGINDGDNDKEKLRAKGIGVDLEMVISEKTENFWV